MINVMLFTKQYITNKFHLKIKNNIKYYFTHGYLRLILSIFIIILISFLLKLIRLSSNRIIRLIQIFENKKKIERLVIQEFENIKFLNIFISIITIIIGGYTCFHVTCFCFIYKHSQVDLFFGSFMTFLIEEIIQILLAIFTSICRVYGLKYKSECFYNFSLFFTL